MIEKTQAQILKHHGGDGDHAREMITRSYERRHDIDFWEFWNIQMGSVIDHGDLIMDLGAGIGQFVNDLALRYPENTVIGVEAAEYMLVAQLPLPENARMLLDDLNDPRDLFSEGKVAAVMANMLIHELNQPVRLFQRVFAWLKPGGRFCLIDLVRQPLEAYLEHKFPEGALWKEPVEKCAIEGVFQHFLEHNRYHTEDLIYMLKACGFEVVDLTENQRTVRLVVEKPLPLRQ
ncbi:class I SAM-dependent methyltransferase [Thiomicrorhabdus sp.]|uniref:class I SAM-dependent methyltransferase n=1 Tax=Thiomicrorhabdus sp. TaxID=2039724 RepID=UPI0029C93D3B|nr:class I SAM-dependent methyltransferase [Thiomicrorhabdus sp.]